MHSHTRFIPYAIIAVLLVIVARSVTAQDAPDSPAVSACLPGAGYTSGCDVDQDNDIDINDIQLTAGRWNTSGAYTSGHNHWGETWTGTGPHGLRLENTDASGTTYGLWGQSASTAGRGVYGYASATGGATYGVYGENVAGAGAGVFGKAGSSLGSTYGVYGLNLSTSGIGMYGYASASSGATTGVSGRSDSTAGVGVSGVANAASGAAYGVYGQSASTAGRGVSGYASASSGATYGVYGQSASTDGRGVYGLASATSGNSSGVYGESDSTSGRGVTGRAYGTSGTTYGVFGLSDSTTGTGVYGWTQALSGDTSGVYGQSDSTAGRGVYGVATAASGTTYGVYGAVNSASGYAGYFSGRVKVDGNLDVGGNLSKGGGSFKIDHPLDPANQYLYHSFVESPDMMNIYNGNVALDDKGEATVTLPDWFGALNRDFRYQLTPIGGWAPLYVAREIKDNVFRIAGGQPGLKVSWQVTGIRQDAYANAHRIPVEEAKPANERGLYLYPTELGQPRELGLDYQRNLDRQTQPQQ